jgi:hypothetical protein
VSTITSSLDNHILCNSTLQSLGDDAWLTTQYPFLDFVRRLNFYKNTFRRPAVLRFQTKKYQTWWTPYTEIFPATGYRNQSLRVARSKGSTRLGASLTEDGSKGGCRNTMFFKILEAGRGLPFLKKKEIVSVKFILYTVIHLIWYWLEYILGYFNSQQENLWLWNFLFSDCKTQI